MYAGLGLIDDIADGQLETIASMVYRVDEKR